ncbi:hypothetical protein GCM10023195_66040 [Actinoallomurus liliacearum]|uniref:Uncharacterized protein n=1 Tax=Actinoallomurus liliacearum TaxID=1080073 RepID=A0ABP8TV93_9ACTN
MSANSVAAFSDMALSSSGNGGVCTNAPATHPVDSQAPIAAGAFPYEADPRARSDSTTVIRTVFSTGRDRRKQPAVASYSAISPVITQPMGLILPSIQPGVQVNRRL